MQLELDGLGRFESGGRRPWRRPRGGWSTRARSRPGASPVAMLSPEQYASRISKLTGADVVVEQGDSRSPSTSASAPADLPDAAPPRSRGPTTASSRSSAPAVGGDVTVRPAAARPGHAPIRRPAARRWSPAAAFVGFLRARVHLRRRRLAPPPVGDPAPAGGRPAARQRRLLGRRPGRGQRRVRRARQGVQLDGAPARVAGWRSSSASARGCRRRSAASASRSPPASTASGCWRSSCRPPSTASAPSAGRATMRDAGGPPEGGRAHGRARRRSAARCTPPRRR